MSSFNNLINHRSRILYDLVSSFYIWKQHLNWEFYFEKRAFSQYLNVGARRRVRALINYDIFIFSNRFRSIVFLDCVCVLSSSRYDRTSLVPLVSVFIGFVFTMLTSYLFMCVCVSVYVRLCVCVCVYIYCSASCKLVGGKREESTRWTGWTNQAKFLLYI